MDRILSTASTPRESKPGSESNEEVLHIPPNSSINEVLPSVFWGGYNQDNHLENPIPLQTYNWCIPRPQPTGPSEKRICRLLLPL